MFPGRHSAAASFRWILSLSIDMKISWNRKTLLSVLIFAITLIAAFGWMLSAYSYSDDYAYSHVVLPTTSSDFWNLSGPSIESISDAVESVANHYWLVNGRLSHFIMIPMQLLPRWVLAVFCAFCIAAVPALLLVVSLPRAKRMRPEYMTLAVLLLWTVFPWYDNFQSLVYQLNYSTASALTLLFIYMTGRSVIRSRRYAMICMCVGFLAAWMHEGFGVPLCAYMFTYMIVNCRWRKRYVLFCVAVAAGTCVCLLSPGIWGRAGLEIGGTFRHFRFNYVRYLSELWPLWCALLLGAFVLYRSTESERKSILTDVLPYAAALATSLGIALIMSGTGRYLWPADLYSVIIIITLAGRSRIVLKEAADRILYILLVLFTVGYFCWTLSLISWQRKIALNEEALDVYLEQKQDKSVGLVYFDLISNEDIPFWLMGLPRNMVAKNPWFNIDIRSHHRIKGSAVAIMPDSLRGRSFDSLPSVARNCPDLKGVWPVMLSKSEIRDVRITAWGDSPAMTPIDRLILMFKGGTDVPASYVPEMYRFRIALPGEDSCFIYFVNDVPRTVACRKNVVIDTIDCR